jgi:hypothetical protein
MVRHRSCDADVGANQYFVGLTGAPAQHASPVSLLDTRMNGTFLAHVISELIKRCCAKQGEKE